MDEKTYHLAPYVGPCDALVTKNYHWNVAVNSHFLQSGKQTISFGKKRPKERNVKCFQQNGFVKKFCSN